MKTLSLFLSVCVLSVPAFAETSAAKTLPAPAPKKDAASASWIPGSAAEVSAPLVLKDGAISQPAQTELVGGGKAVFTFKVPVDGNYLIHAEVNAPDEDQNSF